MKYSLLAISLLFCLTIANTAKAQSGNPSPTKDTSPGMNSSANSITGIVSDSKGVPLADVTIRIKGTGQTVISDAAGKFYLVAPAASNVLQVSHVSMKYQEIQAKSGAKLTIVLQPNNNELNDVIVVGYGTQQRSKALGAISTIDASKLEDYPVTNLAASLTGRIPGLSVNGGTARPGADATLQLRNPVILSKDGGTLSPLYVIDDVIRTESDFNNLDPSEVEDISFLKDAAAAIYGVRSGQGAVVVRTKRGKVGRTQVNINSSYAVNDATMLPTMMNGYELANYLDASIQAQRGFVADGQDGYLAQSNYYTDDELSYFKTHNYNWLANAWKPSHLYRQTVNISGGSDKATFFASASYVNQDGNLDRINFNKWTFRANTDVKLGNGFKVGLSISGDISKNNQYLLKQGGENPENDVKGLLYTPGFTPPYINGYPVRLSQSSNQNTIDAFHFFEVQQLDNYNNSRDNSLNIIGSLQYDAPFLKGLTAKVQYSRTLNNTFPKQYGTRYDLYNFEMTGEHNHIYTDNVILSNTSPVKVSNGNRIYIKPSYRDAYQFDGSLGYNNKFGKHEISALAIVEQTEFTYNDIQTLVEDPTPGAPPDGRFAFGEEDIFETENEGGLLGYIGRLNYSYANKYLAEFQIRYDASTKFAPQNRWKPFYSVSAGWILSQEKFLENSKAINFLKLRLSAGKMGSDNTKEYGYLQRYTPLQNYGAVFGGDGDLILGVRNEAIPNPDVRWDDDLKLNGGVDARFLNNRLSTSVDVFLDHRYNMLTALSASVPILIGSAIASENYATVNGYGYELSVGWRDDIGKNFSYNANAFLTWNDAKAIKVDVEKGKLGTFEDPTGRSTDMGVEGYHYLGMFRTQEEVDAFTAKNPNYTIFGKAPLPGMLYYEDIRGPKDPVTNQYAPPDGIVDENDIDFISKKAANHYQFGLTLGATYKSLHVEMVMAGSFGGQGVVESAARKMATATSSRPAFWSDVWTPENPNAIYPNPYYNFSYDLASSFWFKSAFNFRMRNLNVSYTLPRRFSDKLGFTNTSVYVNVVNPINFYNPYSYKDNSLGSFDAYPLLRTWAFGINLGL
ncbi:SusC/RagA family TonB-linked outer membrane protein [Ilyomonas limi]|uniref:SusC/RagA family TonB-linked outer membrane protein n=1 Tax=Ilyomonas limi TaxID=2575867 RepID=A0A4U3KTX0_9BACT|nr:SusC/RagA family TonB-linked outer membrane protein [Ilyomonas limi]TKK65810.1 SusC/RagA family TonB-linked outer membrane protein [Ilyomonas limi]